MLTQHRTAYPARLPLPIIILRSANISRVYNNANLTNGNTPVEVIGDINDTITYNFTGTQKLIGSSDNSFTYSFANSENYNVITKFGTLSVTEDTPTEIIPDNLIIYSAYNLSPPSANKIGNFAYYTIYIKNPYSERKTAVATIEDSSGTFSKTNNYNQITTDLNPGIYTSITLYHKIIESDIINGIYRNTVQYTIGNLTKSLSISLIPQSINVELSCFKDEISEFTIGYNGYYLGQTIEYKIAVANNGNVRLHNIEIYDVDGTTLIETISQLIPNGVISSIPGSYTTNHTFTHTVTTEDIENGAYYPNHHIISDESSYGISSVNITTNFSFKTTTQAPPAKINVDYIDYVGPRNIFGHVLNETVYYMVNVTNNDEQEIIVTGTDPTSTYDLPAKTTGNDTGYYTIKNNDVQDGYATLVGDYSAEYENNESLDLNDIKINSINVCATNASNFGNITIDSITFNGYSYNNVAMTEGQIYTYGTDYPYYDAYVSDNNIDYYTTYSTDYETFENGAFYSLEDENNNINGYMYFLHEVPNSLLDEQTFDVKTIWCSTKQEYFEITDTNFEGGGSSALNVNSGSFMIKNVWCNIAQGNDVFRVSDGINCFPTINLTLYDIDGYENEYYAEFDLSEAHNTYGINSNISGSETFYSYSKIYDYTTNEETNIGMILIRLLLEHNEDSGNGYLVTIDLKWNPCAAEFE